MSDHERLSTSRPPRPKHCPICGIAMLASRAAPGSRDIDRFECLSCDLVINYSGVDESRPGHPR
jgi:transposase-like protein